MPGAVDIARELKGKATDAAYVEFYTDVKELVRRSQEEGRFVGVDVDMVKVIQKGAMDSVKFEVQTWFRQNRADANAGRLSPEHVAHYERLYALWKAGQEVPVEGTPIKGWAVIMPSQAEAIVRAGIRTVEDLATMNAEAMTRIGMGAVMLKNKAAAWVAQAKDKGPLTMEMAELKKQNDLLHASVEKLTEQNAALQRLAKRGEAEPLLPIDDIASGIALADILEEANKPPPPRKKKEA